MAVSKTECVSVHCEVHSCSRTTLIHPNAKPNSSENYPTPVLIARAEGWRVLQSGPDRTSMHSFIYLCPDHAKWPPEGTR